MAERAVPAALAKCGIASVRDNLPPGGCLDVAEAFTAFFRPEIEARLFRKPAPDGGVSCDANSLPLA